MMNSNIASVERALDILLLLYGYLQIFILEIASAIFCCLRIQRDSYSDCY